MSERPTPQITFESKSHPSFDQVLEKLNQLHDLKQSIDRDISVMEESVELYVNFNGPLRVIPISDTHLFVLQSDNRRANELLEKLKEPNTFGIIMGDFIEGSNTKIADHPGNLELNARQQVWAARGMIKPYVDTGKILCLVGMYNGHEGWGEKTMGYDIVQEIAYGFTQPDHSPLKVVYNGGRLIIHFKNGVNYEQLLYHAPGGGGSDEINPLGAQRMRLWEFISHRDPIDGVGGGDWHHRAGVSKELSYDLRNRKERSHVLYANGTVKGNNLNFPDPFLTRMAKGPTVGPGVQLIFNQPKREKGDGRNGEYVWPSYGFKKGEILYEAAKLWDKTEKQGTTKEILAEVTNRSEKPKTEFDRRSSGTKTKENRFLTPMFEKFRWKTENSIDLPVLVYLLANARYDSTSFEKRDREKLLQIIKQVEEDPFKYALVMRHFINPDVAKQVDRKDILDRFIADFSGLTKRNQLLGVMMSSSLMSSHWKKDVKDGSGRVSLGFRPGDYIYSKFGRKAPIYLNQSLMLFSLRSIEYEFLLLDHLSHSGSEFDPFRGLVQARRKALLSSDVIAGGHMPGAGTMTTPDANYIATGWFSDYDSRGKANKRKAPLGGQGVILYPDNKIVVPVSTFLEATDMHAALMMNAGLTSEEKADLLFKTKK